MPLAERALESVQFRAGSQLRRIHSSRLVEVQALLKVSKERVVGVLGFAHEKGARRAGGQQIDSDFVNILFANDVGKEEWLFNIRVLERWLPGAGRVGNRVDRLANLFKRLLVLVMFADQILAEQHVQQRNCLALPAP